jgi:hypothetical protein
LFLHLPFFVHWSHPSPSPSFTSAPAGASVTVGSEKQ